MDDRAGGELSFLGRLSDRPMSARYHGYRVASSRLDGWDYTAGGGYFVTIRTKDSNPHFGDIVDGELRLSGVGILAGPCWLAMSDHFPTVTCDEWVVIPDHVHGIVMLESRAARAFQLGDRTRTAAFDVPTRMAMISPRPASLGASIRSYKAAVTRGCRTVGYEGFAWQPRYYDHIIRNQSSLDSIRQYIADNPARWARDHV